MEQVLSLSFLEESLLMMTYAMMARCICRCFQICSSRYTTLSSTLHFLAVQVRQVHVHHAFMPCLPPHPAHVHGPCDYGEKRKAHTPRAHMCGRDLCGLRCNTVYCVFLCSSMHTHTTICYKGASWELLQAYNCSFI